MFFACRIWCVGYVLSVSPSLEQTCFLPVGFGACVAHVSSVSPLLKQACFCLWGLVCS